MMRNCLVTVHLFYFLLIGMVLSGPGHAQSVPILVYHHIHKLSANASAPMRRWTVLPEVFEAHMDWVAAHGFHTITMEQLIGHMKHGLELPPKPIVLSFDDGWKDHYNVAFPVLKKHGFTATFFIITDSVGHSAYMNWDQILEMAAAGMDMQAHTVTHPKLPNLSHEQAHYEIFECKRVLDGHLKKPVTVLAYPYGSYDDDVIAITKDAGFEAAVTISGLNGGYLYRADQTYTLNRYAIEGGEDLEYLAHAKGF